MENQYILEDVFKSNLIIDNILKWFPWEYILLRVPWGASSEEGSVAVGSEVASGCSNHLTIGLTVACPGLSAPPNNPTGSYAMTWPHANATH